MDAVLLLVVYGVCLILPFCLAKLWFWVIFWGILGILLAIMELVCFLMTKKTLSQNFWAWVKQPGRMRWWLLAGMAAFWLFLLGHLFIGMLP